MSELTYEHKLRATAFLLAVESRGQSTGRPNIHELITDAKHIYGWINQSAQKAAEEQLRKYSVFCDFCRKPSVVTMHEGGSNYICRSCGKLQPNAVGESA